MNNQKNIKFLWRVLLCGGLFLFYTSNASCEIPSFVIQSNLQLNESLTPITLFLDSAQANYTWFLSEQVIFPIRSLSIGFSFVNKTDKRLKLADSNYSFLKYLKLFCSFGPRASNEAICMQFFDSSEVPLERGSFPTYAKSNYIEAKRTIRGLAICSWSELINLDTGLVQFQLVYDNLEAASKDTSLTAAKVRGIEYTYTIRKAPLNKLDSLFFGNYYADRLNARGQLRESLDVCSKLLLIDSTDFQAYRTATDVLWKMGNYSESIIFAQKAIQLLNGRVQWLCITEANTNVDYLYSEFRLFIDKCQKKEPWQGGK